MPNRRPFIVSLGEAVFDVFPDHRQLGGAPLNLALVADQLLRPRGGRAAMVTRIGRDEPGRALLADIRRRGLDDACVQIDPDRPTGTVIVRFDDAGEPSYEIVRDVAWDALAFDERAEALAAQCDAVAFGTLAQREMATRETIYRFLERARSAVRLIDVNLREDYFSRTIFERSFELATIAKMNHEELPRVAETLGLAGDMDTAAAALRERFDLEMVAVTRGEAGVRLYHTDGVTDGEPARYAPADGADAVGAGDAASAGLLAARILGQPIQHIADFANRCGAYVVSQPGGNPVFPEDLIAAL